MIIDDIRKSQLGDDTATLNLIEKFKPALKKYARKLETEDAYYDLQVEFLDLISHIDCTTLKTKNDGAMVQYLVKSIYHAYVKILQKSIDNPYSISADELTDGLIYKNDLTVCADYALLDIPSNLLTPLESQTFWAVCIMGYSSAELAKRSGVSRQSVNQAKRRAIKKLGAYLKQSGQM